jgi:hypothetical protein
MTLVANRPEGRLDQFPAALVVESRLDRLRDEGTAAAWADAAVELFDQVVSKSNVQSHAHKLAHTPTVLLAQPRRSGAPEFERLPA